MKRPDARQGLAAGAAFVTIALTAAAFWLSYEHLHDVAAANGLSGVRAWAWPATVDLFIVAGELLMLRAALRHQVDPWAVALAGVGSLGSIALNVAGVGTDAAALEYVVAAVPPTAALVAFGALMRQVHERLADAPVPVGVPAPAAVPKTYPAPVRPVLEVVPEGARLLPLEVIPTAAPADQPEYVPAADEYVPDATPDPLTEKAREIFSEDMPPSVRRLRERFNVGQARAQRIRDELTAGAMA